MAGSKTLVVAQTGGPSAVINSTLAGIIEEARFWPEIGKIIGCVSGFHGLFEQKFADLSNLTDEQLQRLRNTPGAFLGSSRMPLTPELFEQIPRLLADLHVDYLLLIGGNGTMFASKIIAEKAQETGLETQVIGVPKTVDNDIMSIDHTPGYASAAKYIAQATLDIGLDLWSMRTFEQVRILEIMGRNVGWLAAAAGLAKADNNGAPHLIYLPEVAFDEDEFINNLDLIVRQQGYALVVVGEGIRDKNNNCIGNTLFSEVNSGSHTYGGAANYLTTKVSQVLNLRARVQDLGMAQRCFYPARSEIDEQEAYLIGRAGVKAAVTRLGGSMVNILDITPPESVKFSAIPLVRIGGKEKQVPEKFYDKQTKQVTKEFVTWLRPLLGQWNSNYLRLDEINLV